MVILGSYGKSSNTSNKEPKREQCEYFTPFFSPNSGVWHSEKRKKESLQPTTRIKAQTQEKCSKENGPKKRNREAKEARQDEIEV